MNCKACNQPMVVAGSGYKSDEGSTEVYLELKLVCTNPKCGSYAGRDLNNPKTNPEIVRRKVN